MRVVMFCHSLISDWNHGNAHFLRGVATELMARGHEFTAFEPRDAWSMQNLIAEHGTGPLERFRRAFPLLVPTRYDHADFDLAAALDGAHLVIVHEWNDPDLVRRIGQARAAGGAFHLLFHDTHHRAVSAPLDMARFDLRDYDGVLAFGSAVRDIYLERGWAQRAWTWHEAADVRLFRPLPTPDAPAGDVVWIGNWGDDERTGELHEFFIDPVRDLRLRAAVYGVRYPAQARQTLDDAGIDYRGWLPNFDAPAVYARFRCTVHVPRRPYASALPGIPTIRPFEALACGIPLISAPWDDTDGLFRAGHDYLVASDGVAMRRLLHDVVNDPALATELARHGRATILARHSCGHRVDELMRILTELAGADGAAAASARSSAADQRPRDAATPAADMAAAATATVS